jgi:hypothetical protein
VNAPGEFGYTPLHDAVAQGRADVVKILLKHGASPLKKNDWGKGSGRCRVSPRSKGHCGPTESLANQGCANGPAPGISR